MNYLSILNQKRPALIASLPGNRLDLAKAAVECGADVVKVHMNVQHRASDLHFGTFEEEKETLQEILSVAKGPCGIVAGNSVQDVERDYRKAFELGFSFVSLYSTAMPLSVLATPGLIKMVALSCDYTLEDVRCLPDIGADVLEASIMRPETYGQRLTAAELLQYNAICKESKLPVVIPSQRKIQPVEVGQLAACGVAGIMIGAVVTGTEEKEFRRSMSAFRNEIDKI